MERPGNVVADKALGWLADNSQKRFFLWMHLYDPHFPYRPPEPYFSEYASHPYDGEIAFADEQVGRIIRFLKEKGIYKNTVIVLCGDHGESLGEHDEKTHGFFYIQRDDACAPDHSFAAKRRGQVITDMVSLVDLMPTILGTVGVEIPSQVAKDTACCRSFFRIEAIANGTTMRKANALCTERLSAANPL